MCHVQLQLVFYVGKSSSEEESEILGKLNYSRLPIMFEQMMNLEYERKKFGDIEQLDVSEGYYELSKKIEMLVIHATNNNNNEGRPFDYLVKADEDTFINVPVVCANFEAMPTRNIYGGKCHVKTTPYREDSIFCNPKFVLSYAEYPEKTFPPYCEGPFYYMSKEVAAKVAKVFVHTRLIKFEDVYVGEAMRLANVSFENLEWGNKNYHFLQSHQVTAQTIFVRI